MGLATVKSNLPMKVRLRVAHATNYQIVLGEPGAESLLGKGVCLATSGEVLCEGIDTLTANTCQYRWPANGRSQQNQSLAIVAANPERLKILEFASASGRSSTIQSRSKQSTLKRG